MTRQELSEKGFQHLNVCFPPIRKYIVVYCENDKNLKYDGKYFIGRVLSVGWGRFPMCNFVFCYDTHQTVYRQYNKKDCFKLRNSMWWKEI